MEHMVSKLVCLATAVGMAFGTFGEGFSDDNITCADESVRAIPIGNRTAYVFTNTTAEAIAVTVKRDITIEKLLVVGGGGAGGRHFGGGGGGGGVVYNDKFATVLENGGQFSVQIGAGGTGKHDSSWRDPGKASWMAIGAVTNMAYGGGSGGNYDNGAASTGKLGSGGGGNNQKEGTTYTKGQGNAGGSPAGTAGGGGGGGASEPGENGGKADEQAGYTRGGNGGEGRAIDITGEEVVYGSGGGGGGRPGYKAKAGKGGTNAADGWWSSDGHAGNAAPDGFGGGGGGTSYGAGGNGGSGTVILLVAAGDQRQYQFTVLPIPEQLYLGTPLRPEPVVSNLFTGAILVKDRDYTLDYEGGSLEPGELTGRGTVIVNGMAGTGFEGKAENTTFAMTRAYQFEIAPIADLLHYHEPVMPEPVLTNAVLGVVPVKDTDYRVEYENNNAAGTATVRAIGIGNYAGFATERTFTLIRAYQFEIAPLPSQLYVDEPVTPEPVLTNAVLGVVPVKGDDYRVEYENNNAPGTATVRAVGLGDYAGYETERTFALVAPAFDDGIVQASSATTFEKRTLGKRVVYIFTNVTEATALYVNDGITIEKMLVVGGGGGGGGTMGAGGGAGGLIYSEEPMFVRGGARLTVSVGKGGAGSSNRGTSGDDSVFDGSGFAFVAVGGGGGGGISTQDGLKGGSGGGGAHSGGKGGPGILGQGYAGGTSGSQNYGGGGGGAGGPGKSTANGRLGGPGVASDITGETLEYARGGKGGGYNVGVKYEPAGMDGRGDGGGGGGQLSGTNYSGTRGGNGTVILYVADHDTVNFRYAVANPGEQVYLGAPARPRPAVSNVVTGAVLTEGVDFTYAYENCDTYGRGRVIANGVDGSDYDGCYAFAEFNIVNGFQFAVEPIPRQAFLGEPVCPSVTVVNTVVGGILSEDTDYTVAYENNEAPGQARAIVSGMTGTGYEGFAVTNVFEIAETYADECLYVPDASVRCIDDGSRKVYVFTNVANVSRVCFRQDVTLVECLVVGGGGAGGGLLAGGGGGGGVVSNAARRILFAGDEAVVAVGAGGRPNASSGDVQGNPGKESSLTIGDFMLVAYGGGGGGTCNSTTKGGVSIPAGEPSSDEQGRIGSGGGSTKGFNNSTDGYYYNSVQGHRGASGPGYQGGGGGGAFAPGSGPVGGEGVTNAITGTEQVYASGGGGGAGYDGSKNGAGGTNAGTGAFSTGRGENGKDGLGAGGGGGGWNGDRFGGTGGSGTVIIALVKGGVAGQPELDKTDVDLGFMGDYTIPRVSFALGGEPGAVYSATVTVSFGVGEQTEPRMTREFRGKVLGDVISLVGDFSPATGSEVWCRIVIEADRAETRIVELSCTATGAVAPFVGHGGGENVLHVWTGAPGDGSGSDWLNAMTDVREALRGISVTKNEIWIKGDLTLETACAKTTLTAPTAIRGGFTGVEDDSSERPRGARSVLDGGDAQNILQVAGNHLLTLDSIEFTHARSRAVERTGGALFVTNCNFEANGTTGERLSARALYASGGSGLTAEFVDTRFAKNTEKGTYADGGACIVLSSFKRATFDNCTFMTNGIIPNVNSGTGGYGEGGNCKGATLNVSGVPLTMRNCRFLGNKAACRGMTASGGMVRLFEGSYPSAFTNCLFVGNSERQPQSGSGETSDYAGAVVVELNSAAGLVDFDTCTFAWNLADCRSSPAAINVRKGAVRVRNSVFWGNQRRDIDTAGADIEVKANGSADVDYSLFAATNEACITTADAAKLTLGAHNVCGDPKFFTADDDFAGIVKTNKSTYNFIYFDWNRLNELVRFNAHVRGGRHVDETTGGAVFARGISPAINAGDPAHDFTNEPKPNGRRVNLGAYGNTPWATTSPAGGALIVR